MEGSQDMREEGNEGNKITIKTIKTKKETYEKLINIKKMYNLSSINDAILFLIMKLQLCETQRVVGNEDSQH
jgi:predicted CopG family antitoxin